MKGLIGPEVKFFSGTAKKHAGHREVKIKNFEGMSQDQTVNAIEIKPKDSDSIYVWWIDGRWHLSFQSDVDITDDLKKQMPKGWSVHLLREGRL